MTAPARRWLALLPAVAYAGLVFALSAQANPLPFLPHALMVQDKVLHGLEYAGLAALLAFGLERVTRLGRRGAAMVAVALGAAYGLTDELHQAFVPGRSADVLDWAADATGCAVGGILAAFTLRWWRARASIRA